MEESSWFGRAYVGSLALTGKLKPSEIQLRHRNTHETLADTILDFLLALKNEDSLLSHGASLVISSMGSCC